MTNHTNLDVLAVLGFGAGLYWFFKGFRVFREYRVLADTPEIPIRSIPMGLVEIHGKATGDQLTPSPVTKTPCFFYKVDIEKWVKDKDGGHWAHYRTDVDGVKFYLEDNTGKVLVDAHSAEYDLIQTGRRDTRGGLGTGLLSLFGRRGGGASSPGGWVTDAELINYVEHLGGRGTISLSDSLEALVVPSSLSLGGSSTGGYRLIEYCILPSHWYDVTGTCVENPNPKDEDDRNMIVKGKNEPTFLISWRSEKQIESTLRNRAAKYIFGGAGLSVLCLGYLLVRLGWL